MSHRRTTCAFALLAVLSFALSPAAGAAPRASEAERTPSFLADPLGFLGAWIDHFLGFEAAAAPTGTQGNPCGEAGPMIDPDGRCTSGATNTGEAGPDIDPDGR